MPLSADEYYQGVYTIVCMDYDDWMRFTESYVEYRLNLVSKSKRKSANARPSTQQ